MVVNLSLSILSLLGNYNNNVNTNISSLDVEFSSAIVSKSIIGTDWVGRDYEENVALDFKFNGDILRDTENNLYFVELKGFRAFGLYENSYSINSIDYVFNEPILVVPYDHNDYFELYIDFVSLREEESLYMNFSYEYYKEGSIVDFQTFELDFEEGFFSVSDLSSVDIEYNFNYDFLDFSYYFSLFEGDNYNNAFNYGYNQGYIVGNDIGFDNGYDLGFSEGSTEGYNLGYSVGFEEGFSVDDTTFTIFNGILGIGLLPINLFLEMFNFNILGINVAALISSLLTISLCIIITKKVL